jgi:hypothetical protein
LLAVCSALLGPDSLARAQNTTASGTPAAGAAVEFADTPFRVPSLGLTMWLPPESRIDTTNLLGGESTFQIVAPDATWMLRGFTSSSRDTSLTPAAAAESLIVGLLKPGADVEESLKDWNVRIAGAKGELLDRT